jgi:queuosine precursor transporter
MPALRLILSAGFLACIPAANWLIGHWGVECLGPTGPCLVPVAPGLSAPSGSLVIGVALVLRNLLQLAVPRWQIVVLIFTGAILSALVAPPSLVIASATAFSLGELSDWAVFSPLRRRRLGWAVMAAGAAGAVVDAFVFISLAFGAEYWLVPGQVIAKAYASIIAAGLIGTRQRLVDKTHAYSGSVDNSLNQQTPTGVH